MERTNALDLGISNNPRVKDEIKDYLDNKTHSSAYIKLCAIEAKRLGRMDLSLALEEIAKSKMENEALLMEYFGVKDDLRLHLNNVIIKATEDVEFASKIANLSKENNEEEAIYLLSCLAIKEADNLEALKGILKQYI